MPNPISDPLVENLDTDVPPPAIARAPAATAR